MNRMEVQINFILIFFKQIQFYLLLKIIFYFDFVKEIINTVSINIISIEFKSN